MYDDDYCDDDGRPVFAFPGSALRAASKNNPRNRRCPSCRKENRLTPADVPAGNQCDECANAPERGGR